MHINFNWILINYGSIWNTRTIFGAGSWFSDCELELDELSRELQLTLDRRPLNLLWVSFVLNIRLLNELKRLIPCWIKDFRWTYGNRFWSCKPLSEY